MTWEFHPAPGTFAQYAADWDRLNGELYNSHPYFDSRFFGPLLKHFASGNELLCLYRERGIVRGALILQPRGAGRWATFLPAQAQITPILVADAGLFKNLLEALPGFAWNIEFLAVDPRYAPAFSSTRAATVIFPHAIAIGIASGIGFEPYWNQRSKKLRSNIRRYADRLAREGGSADISCLVSHEAMLDGVRRFGNLESAGWKVAAGAAVSINNAQGTFYADVLSSFAETGQARICELVFCEQLAASRLILGNEQMQVMLKTTYNDSLARFAPSLILLHRVLERLMTEHPGRTIEFYTNATRDQAEWSTFNCNIQNIQLFRSDSAVVVFLLLRALKHRLKGNPVSRQSIENGKSVFEIHSCESVEGFAAGGHSLEEFAPRDSIEESTDWFDLLQKQVYPDDSSVRYYFVTESGRPTAILPLRIVKQGQVCGLESLSNYYTSLYSPLMSDECNPQVLGRLLSAVTTENRRAHTMRFAPMDPESPVYVSLLNELRATGWIPLTFFCFGNWYLKVNGDWPWYLKSRSGNLRSSIKRRSKTFFTEGGTLEVVSSLDGIESAIQAFQEVYSASWKTPEPYPDFVPSLIRLLASNGMLRLGLARLQGRPIAAQLWIVGKNKASIYKVAYDEAFASFSPGTVLTNSIMQFVIEQDQVNEVDFLIGDDKYKELWMSDRRERWGIIAFNPRTVIGLLLLTKEMGGRIVRRILRRVQKARAPSRAVEDH